MTCIVLFVLYVMNYITCGKKYFPLFLSKSVLNIIIYVYICVLELLLHKFMVYSLGMLELFIWSKNIN